MYEALPAVSQTCMREERAAQRGAVCDHDPTSVMIWMLTSVSVLTLFAIEAIASREGALPAGS